MSTLSDARDARATHKLMRMASVGTSVPHDSTSRVFTVILNYRHVDDTLRCISSLQRSTAVNQRLVVVDNAATTTTTERLRQDLPATTILSNDENLGYAGGNNVGIRHALERGADWVWLLNPDIIVEPTALEWLLAAAHERADAGILGSRILYAHRRPPTIWFNGGVLDLDLAVTEHLDDGKPDGQVPARGPFAVDYVTGAGMLVRREVFDDVGLLPEEWFLYFEETEFNLLASRAGWAVMIDPRSRLVHDKRSTGRLPTPSYVYYYLRNRLVFARRYARCDSDTVHSEIERSWIGPWRAKIRDREPGWLPVFEDLVAAAVRDADVEQTGRRDNLPVECGQG